MKEELENKIRIKSNNRCVMCHNKQADCHLIEPNKEAEEDNLILLCDICACKYIGNPDLIKQIKQKRDYWYKQIEEAKLYQKDIEELFGTEEIQRDSLNRKTIAIYHVVYENEGLEEAAKTLYEVLWSAQEQTPNYNRILYLDIDGHVDENGEFDKEMKELQQDFMLESLLPYFNEIHMPIIDVKNSDMQINDIPKEFSFFSNQQEVSQFIEKEINGGAYILKKVKKDYGEENKQFIYRKKYDLKEE